MEKERYFAADIAAERYFSDILRPQKVNERLQLTMACDCHTLAI